MMLEVSTLENVCYAYGKQHNIQQGYVQWLVAPWHPTLLEFLFYYLILMLLFLLLDHFFCCVCGIPYCCFLISIFLLLSLSFHSFWLFFLLFVFDFSSHTLPVFPQKNPLSPLFFSYAFNLYCVILLLSLQEPHECLSPSAAQYLQLKTNLLQELRQQISITMITNCTMKLRENPN